MPVGTINQLKWIHQITWNTLATVHVLMYTYTHALQAPRPTEHDTGHRIPLPDASEHNAPDQVSSQYTWNTRATVHVLTYMYTHALQAPRPTEHDTGCGIPLPDASEHDAPDQVSSQ